MSGMDNLILIVATEAKSAGEGVEDFEAMSRACMKQAVNHWMVTDDGQRFHGACVAIYELADDTMKERVKHTLDMLRGLSAASSGLPIDFSQMMAGDVEPLPLVKWWQEVKAAA